MNRTRNTITVVVFCLLMVLAGAGLLAAAETPDITKTAVPPKESPAPPVNGVSSPPGGVPSSGNSPVPTLVIPGAPGAGTGIQAPPGSGATTVAKPSPPTEAPGIPVLPPATGSTHEQKQRATVPGPDSEPKPPVGGGTDKRPSILGTLLEGVPATLLDPGTTQRSPKPGDLLHIPPDAAKTGDLSFLEGCWRGARPEYATKRTITECFCFDKDGNGKRFIEDPQYAGKCTGSAKGSFDAQGRLVVTSERASCANAKGRHTRWGRADMLCQGDGASTPCSWRFPDARGGTQSYKISLVRGEHCGG